MLKIKILFFFYLILTKLFVELQGFIEQLARFTKKLTK